MVVIRGALNSIVVKVNKPNKPKTATVFFDCFSIHTPTSGIRNICGNIAHVKNSPEMASEFVIFKINNGNTTGYIALANSLKMREVNSILKLGDIVYSFQIQDI